MATASKIVPIRENPNDPNVRDPEHKHELGGTLGMTVGGVAGGIAAGVAAGATMGGVAGPVGVVIGAAVGGAIGGAAGESIAREVNPTLEEKYWSANYQSRPYVIKESSFETYRPAYRYGVEAYTKAEGRDFDDIEPSIRNDWGNVRGESKLEWKEAREAARDAFERLNNPENEPR
jgi:predicted lipid-binding transport protein (Tim44 family)